MLTALTVLVGVHVLNLSTQTFLLANVALIVGWLLASVAILREYNTAPAPPAVATAA